MSSLAALEVLIGEATVSVANGYNEVLLQQNLQLTTVSLVVLKVTSCFLAHHKQRAPDTFSSLRLSAAVCTFDCYCNTSTVTVRACVNV